MKIDLDNPFTGITECIAHCPPNHMDEDCEHCMVEFNAKKAIVDRLGEDAQTDLKRLALEGMQFPPEFITNMRLELLIESMLQDRNRLHFETEIGRRMTLAIIDAKQQLTRAKLTAPGPMGQHPSQMGPALQVVRGKHK